LFFKERKGKDRIGKDKKGKETKNRKGKKSKGKEGKENSFETERLPPYIGYTKTSPCYVTDLNDVPWSDFPLFLNL
jgi:hypothetical protein